MLHIWTSIVWVQTQRETNSFPQQESGTWFGQITNRELLQGRLGAPGKKIKKKKSNHQIK